MRKEEGENREKEENAKDGEGEKEVEKGKYNHCEPKREERKENQEEEKYEYFFNRSNFHIAISHSPPSTHESPIRAFERDGGMLQKIP